jgi:RNA polymerase sigma-70 factor (ECF subfamily)
MSARIIPILGASDLHDRVTAAWEDARNDVYYYGLTLGLTPAQAQEMAQEVFLRLYVTLRGGEEIANVRGWVFRVAHNFGLKMKAKEREHAPIDEMAMERSPASEASPEAQAIETQRQRRIREALSELSPQQRQCLELRASGMRYREIGETIGIGTSTVNEFIRRAVTRLRKALHE